MPNDHDDESGTYDATGESQVTRPGFTRMPVGPVRAELDARMADDAAHEPALAEPTSQVPGYQRLDHPEKRGRRDPASGLLLSQLAFVTAFRLIPNESLAARKASLSISTIHYWRQNDDRFKQAHAEAYEAARGALFTSMWISAVEGDVEAVYQGGIRVGYRRKFSDRMRELLAKATMPETFDRKSLQGPGVNITLKATPEQIAAVVRKYSPTRRAETIEVQAVASEVGGTKPS